VPSFTARYRFGETVHAISVRRAAPHEVASVRLDDAVQEDDSIPLRDDGRAHEVVVLVAAHGRESSAPAARRRPRSEEEPAVVR